MRLGRIFADGGHDSAHRAGDGQHRAGEPAQRPGDFASAIENIDIGGPAMIRSAAKNHGYVAVCTELEDLKEVLAELAADGTTSLALRKALAARAYARTAARLGRATVARRGTGSGGGAWPRRRGGSPPAARASAGRRAGRRTRAGPGRRR